MVSQGGKFTKNHTETRILRVIYSSRERLPCKIVVENELSGENLREAIKINKEGENFKNEGVVSSVLMQRGSSKF